VASGTASPTPAPSASSAATPTGTPIALPTVAELSAPTGDLAWVLVAGMRLFRSSDRGATWQERGLPQAVPIGDIAFINEREGWLTSVGSPATQCQAQSYAVFHTADGATTWEKVFQSDTTSDAMCKGGLFFADAQRGFLTLTSPNGNPAIAQTVDGGRTWTRAQAFADPPGVAGSGAGLLSAGRVKAIGSSALVSAQGTAAGGRQYAFRSSDGGTTWSYASTAPIDLIAIAFINPSRWLQIFLPNRSSETTDAGVTWHGFVTDYQQAAPVSPQIVFGDANVGYATVRGTIQRTTDGGAHWTVLKTPGT
jgi:photosystem II stability/assembly factor-like uncharacterized protein